MSVMGYFGDITSVGRLCSFLNCGDGFGCPSPYCISFPRVGVCGSHNLQRLNHIFSAKTSQCLHSVDLHASIGIAKCAQNDLSHRLHCGSIEVALSSYRRLHQYGHNRPSRHVWAWSVPVQAVLKPSQEARNCDFRMVAKLVWKIHAIRENAHLARVVPINNPGNSVGKPTRIVRKVLLFAVDWLFVLPIQEVDECSLDLGIAK